MGWKLLASNRWWSTRKPHGIVKCPVYGRCWYWISFPWSVCLGSLKKKKKLHILLFLVTLKQFKILFQWVVLVTIHQKFRRNQCTAVESFNFIKSSFFVWKKNCFTGKISASFIRKIPGQLCSPIAQQESLSCHFIFFWWKLLPPMVFCSLFFYFHSVSGQ